MSKNDFIDRIFGKQRRSSTVIKHGRHKVRDISYGYRMPTGFAGDVNRTHPVDIEPCLISAAAPVTTAGQACLIDTSNQGVRPINSGTDGAISSIYGITVRDYPFQDGLVPSASVIGSAGLTIGSCSVLKSGYIIVKVNGQTLKGGTVYIWVAAASGNHVVGGFESANSAGNTIALDSKSYFNGIPGSDGLVELAFNL